MAGHAQLKFVMTECSKTQIRLTGLTLYLPVLDCFALTVDIYSTAKETRKCGTFKLFEYFICSIPEF